MTSTSNASSDPKPRKVARHDVHRIATEAGQRRSPTLRVLAITGAGSGSYAEVLFSAPAAERDLMVGVFRDSGEQEIRATIEATLNRSLVD